MGVPEARHVRVILWRLFEVLDRIIYKELVRGDVESNSRDEYVGIIERLVWRGAEGVILGCTELTLFTPLACAVPLFDTTRIHVEDALDEALRRAPP